MESYTLLADGRPVCVLDDVAIDHDQATIQFNAPFRQLPAGQLSMRRASDGKAVPILVNRFGMAVANGLGLLRWGAVALVGR